MSKQSDQGELLPARRVDAPPATGDGAYAIIMRAVSDPACDPAKMRELLAVRREWNADEAAAAFNAAVVRFQQECPIIPKLDKAYDKLYARMDRIWRTIRPIMERCGLAITWESVSNQGDRCVLEGHLRHARGHAQALHHEVPYPDLIKGQNATQRAGSGETYAKRYATCAALGVQVGQDDDGIGLGESDGEPVTQEQYANLLELIEATATDQGKLCAWAGVKVLSAFPASKYEQACAMMQRKMKQ